MPADGVVQSAFRDAAPPLTFAHCIVGRARCFVLPCVQRSIATNVMDALPGTSTSFVHLSVPSNKTNWKEKSNVPNVAPSFRPDEIDFLRGAAERFRRFANVGAVWVGPDEPMPVAVLAVAAEDPEFPARFQMWRNVRGCFELVLQHEETARRRFSFVSRIRPDAVFFSSWVLPPNFAQLGGMFIPKGGLGCSTCANDHLALVPRAAAHRYFRDIFEEYSACKNGTCASIHRKGFARRPSHPFAPPRGGASYVYHAVGLEILPTHIPYALANHELAYTGENLTLGCHRLSVHSNFRHRMPYSSVKW